MPKERNKADGYREKAYEGDTKAMNNLGVCYERGTGVKVCLEHENLCTFAPSKENKYNN